VGLVGSWSQKFSLVVFILRERWALGAGRHHRIDD
jgi:hypothetical protein